MCCSITRLGVFKIMGVIWRGFILGGKGISDSQKGSLWAA